MCSDRRPCRAGAATMTACSRESTCGGAAAWRHRRHERERGFDGGHRGRDLTPTSPPADFMRPIRAGEDYAAGELVARYEPVLRREVSHSNAVRVIEYFLEKIESTPISHEREGFDVNQLSTAQRNWSRRSRNGWERSARSRPSYSADHMPVDALSPRLTSIFLPTTPHATEVKGMPDTFRRTKSVSQCSASRLLWLCFPLQSRTAKATSGCRCRRYSDRSRRYCW
jgi:hypothetical protein